MTDPRIHRSRFLIDRSLQLQYVGLVLGITVGVLLVAGGVIYVAGWSHLVERLANVYPQGRLQGILKVIYLRLLLGVVLLTPVTVFAALLVSHRVAGPLVRIRRYLRLMARGEYDLAPLELRPSDELRDIAALINEILARQRADHRLGPVEAAPRPSGQGGASGGAPRSA